MKQDHIGPRVCKLRIHFILTVLTITCSELSIRRVWAYGNKLVIWIWKGKLTFALLFWLRG